MRFILGCGAWWFAFPESLLSVAKHLFEVPERERGAVPGRASVESFKFDQ
jgi:hypothetical protein